MPEWTWEYRQIFVEANKIIYFTLLLYCAKYCIAYYCDGCEI